jgi:hypothetical protein
VVRTWGGAGGGVRVRVRVRVRVYSYRSHAGCCSLWELVGRAGTQVPRYLVGGFCSGHCAPLPLSLQRSSRGPPAIGITTTTTTRATTKTTRATRRLAAGARWWAWRRAAGCWLLAARGGHWAAEAVPSPSWTALAARNVLVQAPPPPLLLHLCVCRLPLSAIVRNHLQSSAPACLCRAPCSNQPWLSRRPPRKPPILRPRPAPRRTSSPIGPVTPTCTSPARAHWGRRAATCARRQSPLPPACTTIPPTWFTASLRPPRPRLVTASLVFPCAAAVLPQRPNDPAPCPILPPHALF